MKPLMILSESIDEGIVRLWYFPVANKYEMAHYILNHLPEYDAGDMFRGISWLSGLHRWRDSSQKTPETLLHAIAKSSIDGDSESGFAIHFCDLSNPTQEAREVTWTPDTEMSVLRAKFMAASAGEGEGET